MERLWSIQEQIALVQLGPDHRVGAHQHAFAALNAELVIPLWDFQCDVSLFPLRCPAWICAIHRELAGRQGITMPLDYGEQDLIHELRSSRCISAPKIEFTSDGSGNLDLEQPSKRLIDCGKVFLNDTLAALCVSLLNRLLNRGNRLFFWERVANRKKASLHDGVDAITHTSFAGNRIGINHIHANMLSDNF